jgi:hypothetical protein
LTRVADLVGIKQSRVRFNAPRSASGFVVR